MTTPQTIVPENFSTILTDFTNDLSLVYPEFSFLWSKWNRCQDLDEIRHVYEYCVTVFPERFFDIIYKNADIFDEAKSPNMNICFLPGVNFRFLYNADGVSDKTREAIWRYLQLVLMTVLGSVNKSADFKGAANLFEAMNENELQEKLTETMQEIGDFFTNFADNEENRGEEPNPEFKKTMESMFEGCFNGTNMDGSHDSDSDTDESERRGFDPKKMFGSMPNPETIHNHLKGLLDGKLGKMAKEFTEEFTSELEGMFEGGVESEGKTSKDIMMEIVKNPQKMVSIFKKLAQKLQDKMKNGEISEEDLMKEMTELMDKMKSLGNEKEFKEMMKNLTSSPFMKMLQKNMGGAGGRIDMGAVQRMQRSNAMKDRLRQRFEAKQQAKALQAIQSTQTIQTKNEDKPSNNGKIIQKDAHHYVFKIGEEEGPEDKSDIPCPNPNPNTSSEKKKKNKKKQKNNIE